ncbi:MAG: hypothetical protein C4298_01190 [Thermus sp.]
MQRGFRASAWPAVLNPGPHWPGEGGTFSPLAQGSIQTFPCSRGPTLVYRPLAFFYSGKRARPGLGRVGIGRDRAWEGLWT